MWKPVGLISTWIIIIIVYVGKDVPDLTVPADYAQPIQSPTAKKLPASAKTPNNSLTSSPTPANHAQQTPTSTPMLVAALALPATPDNPQVVYPTV